jgi:hypothetical protein
VAYSNKKREKREKIKKLTPPLTLTLSRKGKRRIRHRKIIQGLPPN